MAHNVAILHCTQTIAVGCGQIQVMNGCDHGTTAFLHQFHELHLILDIQVFGGLIQYQHGSLLSQCSGDEYSLLLTSGQCNETVLPEGRSS